MTIGGSTSSLAPGFRFHPTDEELVRYYLRRKVCGKPFRCFGAISDIDIYKVEPWDLPGKSRLKTRDLEWYFFSVLDRKYGNGSRTNRATERGYWKTTGKDRAVYHRSQVVGMKKTLVYHSGRAPHGQRTNWVMHEYRLADTELEKAEIIQDAFVLCRVFQKSGSGPKNGEQYGAPFVEEEWEDDEHAFLPKEESPDEVVVSEGSYLDGNDLEQILGTGIPLENVTIPSNMINADNSSYVVESNNFVDDTQKLLACSSENVVESGQPDGGNLFNMPVLCDMHGTLVRCECVGKSSHMVNSADVNYLLEEPFWDASDNPQFNEGAYLETSDLSNSVDADPSTFDLLEEYLPYFDANDYSDYFALDSIDMSGGENLGLEQAPLAQKWDGVVTQQLTVPSQQLSPGNDVASSSKQEPRNFGSDMQGPFVKQASRMLGNIPAPPAFASEFPSKDAGLRLHLASPSSSSTHFTAGMIQIRNVTSVSDGANWSLGKHGNVNFILSFGMSQSDDSSVSLEPLMGISSDKAGSVTCRSWLYFIFFWVLILSASLKMGTFICAR